MNKGYNLIIGSPIDYNELVVYVQINNRIIALVHKEEGVDKMKIEFFNEILTSEIYVDVFIEAINEAKNELRK